MTKELPNAPIARILKGQIHGKQLSPAAVEACRDYIEDVIAGIGNECNRLAEHESRKTVREKDMLFILEAD